MQYILAYKEDLTFNGFYVEGVHSDIPSTHILINVELWEYLLSLGEFVLVEEFEPLDREYTLEDKDLFVPVVREATPVEPSETEVRLEILEEENAMLILDSAIKDSKIELLENDLADLMFEIAIMKGGM